MPFVCDLVQAGSEILTDGWRGYNALGDHGYTRTKTVLSDTVDPAHVAMPGVHRIAALLKRWLLGTHQGAVSAKHLDYYLDEYTFRFNRRSSRARGLLFRLSAISADGSWLTTRACKRRPFDFVGQSPCQYWESGCKGVSLLPD